MHKVIRILLYLCVWSVLLGAPHQLTVNAENLNQQPFYGDRIRSLGLESEDQAELKANSNALIQTKEALKKLKKSDSDNFLSDRVDLLRKERELLHKLAKHPNSEEVLQMYLELVEAEEQLSKNGFAPPLDYLNLGRTLWGHQRTVEARLVFIKMMSELVKYPELVCADPPYLEGNCLFELGTIFEKLGDKENAAKCYQAILKQAEPRVSYMRKAVNDQNFRAWYKDSDLEKTRTHLADSLWASGKYIEALQEKFQ